MSIICVPDIHNKIDIVDQILELEPNYDKFISLGDVFDDFWDTPKDAEKVAIWLKNSLSNNKHIHLKGNHDLSYEFPGNPKAWCSGFTHDKCRAIRAILNDNDFAKLKLYHREDNILFSHAGISHTYLNFFANNGLIKKQKWDIDFVCESLDSLNSKAEKAYRNGDKHELYGAGQSRGGVLPVGSPLWCDQSEFFPTDFPQIYGHSPRPIPEFKLVKKGYFTESYIYANEKVPNLADYNWGLDIDDHLNCYCVLYKRTLKIYKLKFDKNWKEKNRNIIDRELIFFGSI